jgi:hypothetical protein
MSHPQQRTFCKQVRKKFPNHFRYVSVADIGSMDINGNNRNLFRKSYYTGIDVMFGKNVNHVGRAHHALLDSLEYLKESLEKLRRRYWWGVRQRTDNDVILYDTIISTEALEHDKYFNKTLTAIYASVRSGGLILLTAAGEGRPEHGTSKVRPQDSPGTNDYYKNVTNEMVAEIYPPHLFEVYYLAQDKSNCDMQFYGIKK